MKKLIAIASLSLSFVFAYTLASADETTTSKETKTESTYNKQEPGTSPDNTSMKESDRPDSSRAGTVESKDISKTSKSCTDPNGVTYQQNEPGFKACLKSMKKDATDQMSGQASESTTESTRSSNMGSSSNS